ncbi:MAG: gamma-glutamyl-gamma-aminobutyrate hydrolase family protein [Oscillospiraceae bacterium]|nr:gamma-glutamyl-gamma-aminobutyrate hydrolase family protein [Oscillospiraceae bacterium]
MSKPIIGILPLFDLEKGREWMLGNYPEAVFRSGGIPLVFPLTQDRSRLHELLSTVDGVIFTGGPDVDPGVYGEKPDPTVKVSPERDAMELALLPMALESAKPVFCICRGEQLLNAALGGTLWQDLPSMRGSGVNHNQSGEHFAHRNAVLPSTPLASLIGEREILVNSLHHQAIKDLAPALAPMAVSEDGLVEAVYMPEKSFVWGVQWHPERSFDVSEDSRKLFGAFINACK